MGSEGEYCAAGTEGLPQTGQAHRRCGTGAAMQTPAAAIDRHRPQNAPGYHGREATRSPPFPGAGFSNGFQGSPQFPAQLGPVQMKELIGFPAPPALGFPLPPCISHIPPSRSQTQPSRVPALCRSPTGESKKNMPPSTEPLFSAFPVCLS